MDDIEKLKSDNISLRRELEDERNKLDTVLQSIVDGVYTTDIDRKITFWNKGAERITGFRADDVLGKYCRDILRHTGESGGSLCETACPLEKTMSAQSAIMGKDVYSGTVWGRLVPVSVSCSPIIDKEGDTVGAIEVFRDISGQKQLERQKEDFYSMLTHDLKSPLQVIMGYAELMNSMPPAQLSLNSADFINIILLNCSSMHSLINDFLSISRLESGSMHLDLRKSNLAELAKRVHDNYMPACLKKDISLKASLPDSSRESLLDEKLIERALTNLVSNAIKFTPRHGTVSISLAEVDGSAVMTVSDTGPGISPEDIGLVFEKYYRTKPTAGKDGVGLGLAIVKSIVEAHGGSVAVESAPGKGSDFIINLPIDNPPESR